MKKKKLKISIESLFYNFSYLCKYFLSICSYIKIIVYTYLCIKCPPLSFCCFFTHMHSWKDFDPSKSKLKYRSSHLLDKLFINDWFPIQNFIFFSFKISLHISFSWRKTTSTVAWNFLCFFFGTHILILRNFKSQGVNLRFFKTEPNINKNFQVNFDSEKS